MGNLPADIINQALDAAGVDIVIGDPEEGTREAQVCLRAYNECIRQLLRSANWDFARKQAPLNLLADASNRTPNVGSVVPMPWTYEYSYPIDCMKIRFIPSNPQNRDDDMVPGNTSIPNTPLTTGQIGIPSNRRTRLIPARFVIGTDYNYPVDTNQADGQWWEIPGGSPGGRTVILTNVHNAQAIYTAYIPYPNMWDSLFRAAIVSYIASEVVLPLSKDKKFGLALRAQLIATVKTKLEHARIIDGNEGTYSSDISVDWIQVRFRGGFNDGWGGGGEGGIGGFGGSFDSCSFSDGTAY